MEEKILREKFRAEGLEVQPPQTHEVSTTGNRHFAECVRHSAKPEIHSAKALPSAALGKEHSTKNYSVKKSLPSAGKALGKDLYLAK